MPVEIAHRINAALVAGLQEPEVVQRLTTLGFEPVAETVEEAQRFIEADVARNAELLRIANFRPE
jgi:tripartite-type tricarboxylate transporter receptor subunit TctC